ncbi:hypothetical protein U9M48_041022 [Paspalum notatum var. saurae]|uniref:Uncharacterized protein n=1 Tax=Paspalum notatum var. saurae TaxID=547442 RepID=A0AAQ3XED5_PASNO
MPLPSASRVDPSRVASVRLRSVRLHRDVQSQSTSSIVRGCPVRHVSRTRTSGDDLLLPKF